MKKEYFIHGAILSVVFSGFVTAYIGMDYNIGILLIMILTVIFGFGTWILGYKITPKLTQIFFRIQNFSILYLIFPPKLFKDERYFLSHTTRNTYGTLFLLWIGSWALVVSLADNLSEPFDIHSVKAENTFTKGFQILIIGWFFTPLVAFVVLPLSVIESSNLRILLKEKGVIISPTTPFRYVIGGSVTINILSSILRGLELSELLASILFMPAPFYIMTLLYRLRSEKFLIANFKSYLKKRGISEKEINLS